MLAIIGAGLSLSGITYATVEIVKNVLILLG